MDSITKHVFSWKTSVALQSTLMTKTIRWITALFTLGILLNAPLRASDAVENITKEFNYLKENGERKEVKTTSSGLQYEIIKTGTGKTPVFSSTVVTHYRGSTLEGKTFDSSYERGAPATFPVRGVIAGWTEALQLMKQGDKWKLFVPSKLAYGASGMPPRIQPNEMLIFEIELIEVK